MDAERGAHPCSSPGLSTLPGAAYSLPSLISRHPPPCPTGRPEETGLRDREQDGCVGRGPHAHPAGSRPHQPGACTIPGKAQGVRGPRVKGEIMAGSNVRHGSYSSLDGTYPWPWVRRASVPVGMYSSLAQHDPLSPSSR